jgi:iron complex transport system substrate-binding protein
MTRRVLLLAVLALVAACSAGEKPSAPAASAPAPASAPQRIISLAPALTSMLFRLGLGPQVVGVTRYCDDPPEAATRPHVGGFADADPEAILALKPDLVVAVQSPAMAGLLTRLESFGVRTLAVQQDSLTTTWAAFEAVGRATGKADEATTAVAAARTALPQSAARAAGLKGKRVLFVYGRAPLVVAGPGSFGDELLGMLGAVNAAAAFQRPWPKLTAEEVVTARPDVILDAAAAMEGEAPGFFTGLPGLSGVQVVAVTHPGLMQPGVRVVEGLSWLAERFP